MQPSKTTKHKVRLRPEFFILIAIILCLTLISGHNDYVNNSAISIMENGSITLLDSKEDIIECINQNLPVFDYRYGTCYLIEIQDANGKIIDRLSFENSSSHDYLLDQHNVLESINSNQKSEVSTTIDGVSMTVYSSWVECGATKYLIQYVINDKKVVEALVYKILLHVVIVLCYVMLLRTIYFQIKGTSNKYEKYVHDLYANSN